MGDLSFAEGWTQKLWELPGRKILIRGNHDRLPMEAYLDAGWLVPVLSKEFRMPKHRAEHFCMDIGDQVAVKLRTRPEMMGVLIDSFGKDFPIEKEDGGTILVKISCADEAMYRWAMLHGGEAEIVEPENLRERLRNTISRMTEVYKT